MPSWSRYANWRRLENLAPGTGRTINPGRPTNSANPPVASGRAMSPPRAKVELASRALVAAANSAECKRILRESDSARRKAAGRARVNGPAPRKKQRRGRPAGVANGRLPFALTARVVRLRETTVRAGRGSVASAMPESAPPIAPRPPAFQQRVRVLSQRQLARDTYA